jgi:Domain of unknown function (DUF1918)
MRASVGDRIVVYGRRVQDPAWDGEVVEVRGAAGRPPYLVRWSADGHQGLFFPGPDARVKHVERGGGATHEVGGHVTADGGLVCEAVQTGPVRVLVRPRARAAVDPKDTPCWHDTTRR